MPTITITYTDSDDPQSLPQSYTLPQDVAAKLLLVADEYGRDPMRQAWVILADAMGLWKPKTPAQIATVKVTDSKTTDKHETKGKGKGKDAAKETNGVPAAATIGSVPLTGTGLS